MPTLPTTRPTRRSGRRIAAATAAVVTAGTLAAAMTAGAAVRPRTDAKPPPAVIKRTIQLRPGLSLTVIRYPRQPNEVRILTVTPSLGPRLDVQPGRELFPIFITPSTVAHQHGDAAIVNAAFTSGGVPVHASLVDGELWTSGTETADALGLSANGRRAFMGRPTLQIGAQPEGGTAFRVKSWNARRPKGAEVSAYTSRGGNVVPPPGSKTPVASDPAWCAARLVPTGRIAWSGGLRAGITRAYQVQARPDGCAKTPEAVGTTHGAVVLAAHGGTAGAHTVEALTVGQTVHLSWSFAGWPGVTDVIGGEPLLVNHGANVAPRPKPGDPYFYFDNPRTAAGVNAGCLDTSPTTVCKVTLITDDGRRPGWSKGWLLRQLAAQFLQRGVVRALNFDGGGSTEMWVRRRGPYCRSATLGGGCLVDKPSGVKGERPTTISLGVLPGADPGEILPLPAG